MESDILDVFFESNPSISFQGEKVFFSITSPSVFDFLVYYPELSVWVCQEPFPDKEMEGRLPKGRLPVPKEVNRKKDGGIGAASLTPLGGNELHSPGTSYLHSF
uniref:Neuronal regeneration-related protein n=2 Tax=Capra hircus TaxID=9925 RepID=A0A8C2NV21_CAPHI